MSTPEDQRVKVDIRLKDTEWGWMQRTDRFYLKVIPLWFNLIGWITLIGGIEFLRRKTDSPLLGFVVFPSMFLLWRYLVAVFEKFDFVGILPNAPNKMQFFLSEVISAIIVIGGSYLTNKTIIEVATLSSS